MEEIILLALPLVAVWFRLPLVSEGRVREEKMCVYLPRWHGRAAPPPSAGCLSPLPDSFVVCFLWGTTAG
jgi:hypothetical protein